MIGAYNISDFEAFADCADEFHPNVKFFATFNPKVNKNHHIFILHQHPSFVMTSFHIFSIQTLLLQLARGLDMKLNEVDFYEPFIDDPVVIPGKPYSVEELVEFIEDHNR